MKASFLLAAALLIGLPLAATAATPHSSAWPTARPRTKG